MTDDDAVTRARANLARLSEAESEERRAREDAGWPLGEPAGDAPTDRCVLDRPSWDPANPRRLTVGTMTTRDFAAWSEAGRPPLDAHSNERASVARSRGPVDAVGREELQQRLDDFADVIGEEVGTTQRVMRAEIEAQIAKLRAEIEALRSEIDSLKGVVDLPGRWKDWPALDVH